MRFLSLIFIIFAASTTSSPASEKCNQEAFLLDKAAAAELLQPTTNSEVLSLKSMYGVDERKQYKHLSQLLHMQQAIKYKR